MKELKNRPLYKKFVAIIKFLKINLEVEKIQENSGPAGLQYFFDFFVIFHLSFFFSAFFVDFTCLNCF